MARLDSGAPITGGTMAKALIRIVTCGSVDDGKSTLLGRLLAETDSLPTDLVEAARFTRRPGSASGPASIPLATTRWLSTGTARPLMSSGVT